MSYRLRTGLQVCRIKKKLWWRNAYPNLFGADEEERTLLEREEWKWRKFRGIGGY